MKYDKQELLDICTSISYCIHTNDLKIKSYDDMEKIVRDLLLYRERKHKLVKSIVKEEIHLHTPEKFHKDTSFINSIVSKIMNNRHVIHTEDSYRKESIKLISLLIN